MIISMTQELRKRMNAEREVTKIVFLKKRKSKEQPNRVEEHNNWNEKYTIYSAIEGINSRINYTEKWISELEDRLVKITAMEQNKKKKRMKRNEDSLRDLWNNTKHINIFMIEVSEGKERKKGADMNRY